MRHHLTHVQKPTKLHGLLSIKHCLLFQFNAQFSDLIKKKKKGVRMNCTDSEKYNNGDLLVMMIHFFPPWNICVSLNSVTLTGV